VDGGRKGMREEERRGGEGKGEGRRERNGQEGSTI